MERTQPPINAKKRGNETDKRGLNGRVLYAIYKVSDLILHTMNGWNLERIMPYPGRFILIGATPRTDRVVVVYAITGRSAASRARRLTFEASAVWAEPLDDEAAAKGRADLLYYRAIAIDRMIAVSNGRQTDDIAKVLKKAGASDPPRALLARALESWTYEPDEPHFTPRISGCVLTGGAAALSLIKRGDGGVRVASSSSWALEPGRGRIIATYAGPEGNPLPSFSGDPGAVELEEASASEMAESVYRSLNPDDPEKDYRVAVACIIALRPNLRNYDVHIVNRREG